MRGAYRESFELLCQARARLAEEGRDETAVSIIAPLARQHAALEGDVARLELLLQSELLPRGRGRIMPGPLKAERLLDLDAGPERDAEYANVTSGVWTGSWLPGPGDLRLGHQAVAPEPRSAEGDEDLLREIVTSAEEDRAGLCGLIRERTESVAEAVAELSARVEAETAPILAAER